jgi:hypothetical protein
MTWSVTGLATWQDGDSLGIAHRASCDISDDTKMGRRRVEVTGVVRRRRWSDKEKGRMSSSLERSMVDLGNQHGRNRLPDRAKRHKTMNLFSAWKILRIIRDRRFSIRFDFLDLITNKLVVQKHPFNITTKKRRQTAPVPGCDTTEALS